MINTILTGVALMATTALAGPGSAIVVNKCNYEVHLSNTPASGGGYSAINQMLSSGGSYSQVYTELSNGNGWSIKLSQNGDFASNLMQYEYTYHDDGTIWYDLSEVDGNPWDGNWEITASPGCTPRQAAYRYSTDDAYGMQSCADTATITVTLCSGTNGGAPSVVPSKVTSLIPTWGSSTSEAPTSEAPVPSSEPKHHHHHHHSGGPDFGNKVVAAPEESEKPVESKAPASSEAWNGPATTIVNTVYKTVNEIVTATEAAHKRHVHHARHPHHRA